MKRIPIVILMTAIFTGAFLFFFSTCNLNPQKVKPDKKAIIEAEKKALQIDKHYQKEIALLKVHSDSLGKQLTKTQSKLEVAKLKLHQTQITLIALIKKNTDSLNLMQQLVDCDSLKGHALTYLDLADTTQILFETNIFQLHNLVAIKDSQVISCRASYFQLKNLCDENLERERKLTEDLQTAYKSQRRKVLQNKLLAGGFLVLSGICTSLYINANK